MSPDTPQPSVPPRIAAILSDANGAAPRFALRTGARMDVGSWLGKRRVWACVCDDRLVLAAAGPRPFRDETPLEDLGESAYNHVTGAVVLAPLPPPSLPSLPLAPEEGYRLLDFLLPQSNRSNMESSGTTPEAPVPTEEE